MKLYGYEVGDERLLTLREASITGTPDEIRLIGQFLEETADLMDLHGTAFGHEHFCDFCTRQGRTFVKAESDLIVVRPLKS